MIPTVPKGLNILLVEDDDGDAKAVMRAFKTCKIANPIVRAIDGLDALDILRGNDDTRKVEMPCLLLVDLNMPRMDGISFIKELRADERLHRVVVFMLTTSKREEDILAAYDLNIAGYIFKQTAGEDFLKLVDLIDGYWRVVEIPI